VIENQEELRIGDRVAVEFPIEFEEVAVSSIRVNDQDVQCAKVGDPVGILWSAEMPKLKEGMRVFRVSADVRA
jgi:GTPase